MNMVASAREKWNQYRAWINVHVMPCVRKHGTDAKRRKTKTSKPWKSRTDSKANIQTLPIAENV